MRLRWLAALFCLSLPAWAGPKDADQARKLMREGDSLYFTKDFSGALERYRAADAIMNVPSTRIAVAKAQAELGKLVEARDTALSVARIPSAPDDPPAFVRSREEAKDLAKDLADRIPSIELIVEGVVRRVEMTVTVDGTEVPRAAVALPRKLNPGPHKVVASAPGYRNAEASVTLKERESRKLQLVLETAHASSPISSSGTSASTAVDSDEPKGDAGATLMWVGFGVAGAGIVVGSVTGVLSLSKAKEARDQCNPDDTCPPAAQDEIDSSKSLATVSNISFGVALIGAGVGVYGLVTRKKQPEAVTARRVKPIIGLGYVGIASRF